MSDVRFVTRSDHRPLDVIDAERRHWVHFDVSVGDAVHVIDVLIDGGVRRVVFIDALGVVRRVRGDVFDHITFHG